ITGCSGRCITTATIASISWRGRCGGAGRGAAFAGMGGAAPPARRWGAPPFPPRRPPPAAPPCARPPFRRRAFVPGPRMVEGQREDEGVREAGVGGDLGGAGE